MSEDKKIEPLSTEPYKGVRDFYPEDWKPRALLIRFVRRSAFGAMRNTTLLRWSGLKFMRIRQARRL